MIDERVVLAPVGDSQDGRAAVVRRGRERGFTGYLLEPGDDRELSGIRAPYLRTGEGILEPAAPSGTVAVPVVPVGTPAELDQALAAGIPRGAVAVRWRGNRVIPLETAVATGGRRVRVWVVTDRAADLPAALGALEVGADRVFVEVAVPSEVDALEAVLEQGGAPTLDWASARVETVGPGGIGDRVIVDLTSLLAPQEGMLVGSAAAFLFHVASEAEGSAYTRPRAFRVNAGAAHSYTLLADGTTRYLSELEAGDAVCVATPGGAARSARVGRLKIERRPMVMVRALALGHRRTVFVQEAETVRLSSQGNRIAVTALVSGTAVDGVRLAPARHLGAAVDESIEER